MADSYVCSGATMRCTMGTSTAKLTVLPSRTMFLTGPPQANISDHISMRNLAPFGRCRSLGFPATASATAANHGHLTPMPCVHNTPFPWMGGKDDYIIRGDDALLKSSTCSCMWGGTISIVDDGQRNTGVADLSRKPTEEFEKDQVKTDGLSPEDVLDGIQMALDVAGMVPVLGAAPDLLNAAISACRGNWADAGMSLLAAVPGAGDAVGGAKIVKNGVKIAQRTKVTKIENAVETSGNISREQLAKIRAKRLGVEYDQKNSQILYDTSQNQNQSRLLEVTKRSTVDAPQSDNFPNFEIDSNAKNNPFSMSQKESLELNKTIEKPTSPTRPKDFSTDARTYTEVDPHPHLGKKLDKIG